MRKISLESLQPGMILGRSLFADANTLALAAGQKLDVRYINQIRERGYQYTWIEDEGFEDVNPQDILSDTTRRLAESAMSDSVDKLVSAVKMRSESGPLTAELLASQPEIFNIPNVEAMSNAIGAIVRDVIDRNIRLVDVFAEVARSTYLYRHAVNVAALSVLIGRQFGLTSVQLRQLGLAGLLHDFGKIILGPSMIRPKSHFDEEQILRFEEHPNFGSILMQNTDPELSAERLAILHHHERQEGGGYPQGLRGRNESPVKGLEGSGGDIHPYAEILQVAEAYDNLVNGNGEFDRVLEPAEALGIITSLAGKHFNQSVCYAFSQIVCLYPTGSMVQIAHSSAFGLEGYFAIVKEQGPDPAHPTLILYSDPDGVRVKPKSMDFSQDQELKLSLMI